MTFETMPYFEYYNVPLNGRQVDKIPMEDILRDRQRQQDVLDKQLSRFQITAAILSSGAGFAASLIILPTIGAEFFGKDGMEYGAVAGVALPTIAAMVNDQLPHDRANAYKNRREFDLMIAYREGSLDHVSPDHQNDPNFIKTLAERKIPFAYTV